MNPIEEGYEDVLRQIADAADIAGRDPSSVTLVGVSKTVGVPEVELAIAAGLRDFGENRAQEFVGKQGLFPGVHWHFIGSLQTNKVGPVVGRAHLIHSVDSMRLLAAIDGRATEIGVVQPLLLQVNVSGEAAKHGMTYEGAEECLIAAQAMPGIEVRGLMTMAPLERPESVRWVFRETAEWLARMQALHCSSEEFYQLSMGMTNDFGVAVEEGATIVRVGRAIFGR